MSDSLVRRGKGVTLARKVPLVRGMLFASVIALAVIVPSAAMALALLSVCYASLTFAAASVRSLRRSSARSRTSSSWGASSPCPRARSGPARAYLRAGH